MPFYRRDFLQQLMAIGGGWPLRRILPRIGDGGGVLPRPAAGGRHAFEEILGAKSGIRWVHTAGLSAAKHLPETSGAGCAFFDFDNDGWMDIYLVNSGKCDFYDPSPPLRNALYKNNRDGTFTDVTEKAGVAGGGYGMGVAAGDYNNDGFADLYVTQYGRSILYRNNGDGTFTDVTEKAGVAARAGHRARCGLTMTTMGGSICLSANFASSTNR